MSSSGWGQKLQAKLDALTNASSKESCQALAKWIGFNRKHVSSHFVPVLVQSLRRSDKQSVTLSVVHEFFVMDRDNNISKWEKMGDVRLAVGEHVLLPTIPKLSQPSKDRVEAWLANEWNESGLFGERPTLAEHLRRALTSTSATAAAMNDDSHDDGEAKQGPDDRGLPPPADPQSSAAVPTPESFEPSVGATAAGTGEAAASSSSPASQGASDRATKEEPARADRGKKSTQQRLDPAARRDEGDSTTTTSPQKGEIPAAATAAAAAAAPYDFESKGIPASDVDPDDLLRHSRQIATLQIGRDLRNDNAVQLSSLLSSLPSDVRSIVQDHDNDIKTVTLDDDTARDLSRRINPALLDMDLDEQLQDVLHFRELVMKQKHERTKLIELLVASRGNFGANDAASAFSKADRSMGQLVERRQVLLDAMELEGLDVTAEEAAAKEVKLDDLPPLTWYRPQEADAVSSEMGEHDAKRQKARCVS